MLCCVVWCDVPKALLPEGKGRDALLTGIAKRARVCACACALCCACYTLVRYGELGNVISPGSRWWHPFPGYCTTDWTWRDHPPFLPPEMDWNQKIHQKVRSATDDYHRSPNLNKSSFNLPMQSHNGHACARDKHAAKQKPIMNDAKLGSPWKTVLFAWGKNSSRYLYKQCT